MPGRLEGLTMATLLVSVVAPPRPSIWRASGEPMAASRTLSRGAESDGRSLAMKYGPLEVPPRMTMQGMAICEADMRISRPVRMGDYFRGWRRRQPALSTPQTQQLEGRNHPAGGSATAGRGPA